MKFLKYDFEKMEKLQKPYFVKKMSPAYELDDIDYFKIGELCEIEIIGNDVSTNIGEIDLWLEYPYAITLNPYFDYVLIESFTDYDYLEVWG